MSFFWTLRILILDLFEYVTRPRLKILDESLTEIIELDSNPPVHDSTVELNHLERKILLIK